MVKAYSKILFIGLLLIVCFASVVRAQQVIYQCDFENAAEHANWHLNERAASQNPENMWYIGATGNFSEKGHNGLFVSSDGTNDTYTCSKSMFVTAYRVIHFAAGDYQLRFDWRAFGKNDGTEGIFVMLVPNDKKVNSSENSADIPDPIKAYMIYPKSLSLEPTWSVANIDFKVFPGSEGDYKLCFYWFSKSGAPAPPAAGIDNILVVQKNNCAIPSHCQHTVQGHKVTINWTGSADWYDLVFYDEKTDKWQYADTVTTTSYTFNNFSEGIQSFYIRAHCKGADDTYSGYTLYKPFLFWKGERCIDYMELNEKTCSYNDPQGGDKHNPSYPGAIDYGFTNDSSRHTLHYVDNEYDPLTIDPAQGTALLTKPRGVLASVRIGNRLSGGDSERCTYTYKVTDVKNAILKIKYAIVLQDGNHDREIQPRFTIKIKHNNKLIDNHCGEEDFRAKFGSDIYQDQDMWHLVGEDIYWHDWDTLSINLRDYIGETVSIIIESHDCWQSAHLGYAYFVLECVSGDLTGENCGDTHQNTTLTAPDGFTYNWYRKYGPTAGVTLHTNQTHTIDKQDTAIYCVDINSKTKKGCFYTLDVCGLPRIPIGETRYNPTSPCHNNYRFYNLSRVIRKTMQGDEVKVDGDVLSSLLWDWGDGTTEYSQADSLEHTFPDKGGHFVVRLTAGVAGDQCLQTYEYPIDMPDMTINDTHVHLTEGQYYAGSVRGVGDYDETFVDEYSCERIEHIHVYQREFPMSDTICEGQIYRYGDTTFVSGGEKRIVKHKRGLLDPMGNPLDSIIVLSLHEIPMPKYTKADTIALCGDESGTVIELQMQEPGALSDAVLLMSDAARQAGWDSIYPCEPFRSGDNLRFRIVLPRNVRPDYYPATLVFHSDKCEIPSDQVMIQINYPSSWLSERTNDHEGFITLLQRGDNDSFVRYTWYRNGVKIAEGSEPYIGASSVTDYGAKYEVVITRKDGVSLPTCPYYFNVSVGLDQVQRGNMIRPTCLNAGEWIYLDAASDVIVYSQLGQRISNYHGVTSFPAPMNAGIYLVHLVNNNIHITSPVIIK